MVQAAHLIGRASSLRNASTPFEALLWRRISRSQLGHKFRRQQVIGNCIVDFFCPQKGLIVEVDGNTHNRVKDDIRDRVHDELGFTTLRFTNAEAGKNIGGVLECLAEELNALPDRWPHPNPSPEGEGR